MIDLKETPLSTEQRNALDDKEFGIPELRAYPLNDVSHVEQAVRMFNHVDPEYEKELADNLNKAIKKFGLKERFILLRNVRPTSEENIIKYIERQKNCQL